MADQLQLRRGTTAQMLVFTGAQGEAVVNTDNHSIVVHDGITAGGFPSATSKQVTEGTFYYNENVGSAANAYILDAKINTSTPSSYLDGVQFGFVTTHPNTGPSTANFAGLGVKSLKYAGGVDPQPGDISGRVYLVYDTGNDWMEIQRKALAAPPQIRTIGASVGSNSMTVTLQPDNYDFRSSSLGSGTINRRTVTAALSLAIPAGATLGTQSGVQSQIAVLAIDNAGTVQLGVCNMAGFTNLDETTLVTTVAITSGSNQANTVYSSSAVVGAPFRVVGFVQSTQATAGTWATVPSEIQGQGGQAIIGSTKMILAPSVATTSGTAIDFTGIPSWVKRISILMTGISTNGTSLVVLQVGAGSIQASGYSGATSLIQAATVSSANNTANFSTAANAAIATFTGKLMLTHMGANLWIADGLLGFSSSTSTVVIGGGVTVTGVLDRVRLTTAGGTDAFDNGVVTVLLEG